jgi:hypothetical protein
MPIPTTAALAPSAPYGNNPLNGQRLEYYNFTNNVNLLMRQAPQLIPKPEGNITASGFYNVFMTIAPTTDAEVLYWAKNTVESIVEKSETISDSNIRAKDNIFSPNGLTYPRANGGVVIQQQNNSNPPAYPYDNAIGYGENVLSNAGTNYYV